MRLTVNKHVTNSDDELYRHYQGQSKPQPVILCLNLETGDLSAYVWSEIGCGQTSRSFHCRDLEWSIPCLRSRALKELMDGIEEDCQMILDHSEITWNGSNHVGTFDDQAEEASVRIYEYIESWPYDSADVYEVWAAGDYLSDNDLDDLGLTGTSTDDEIRAKAEALVEEAEVALDVDDMEQYLLALRADVD